MKNGSLVELAEQIRSTLEECRNIVLNVAVVGAPGCGKTTLINALMTTSISNTNNIIKIWELSNKNDEYGQEYDLFLLLFTNEFTESDAKTAAEIAAKRSLPAVYFVQTKISTDDATTLPSIRSSSKDSILRFFPSSPPINNNIFLVDSNHPHKYDFELLKNQVVIITPEMMRQKMLSTLQTTGRSLIASSVANLKSRVIFASLLSLAITAGLPIPFISAGIDLAIVWKELAVYQKQLGLDEESLAKFAAATAGNNFHHRLRKIVDDEWFDTFGVSLAAGLTKEALIKKMLSQNSALYFGEFTATYTPMIGNIAAAGLSFFATRYALDYFLTKMERMALDVFDACMKQEKTL